MSDFHSFSVFSHEFCPLADFSNEFSAKKNYELVYVVLTVSGVPALPGVTAVNGVSAVVASLLLLASLRLPASRLFLGPYCCSTPSVCLAGACVPTLDGAYAIAIATVYSDVGIPVVAEVPSAVHVCHVPVVYAAIHPDVARVLGVLLAP